MSYMRVLIFFKCIIIISSKSAKSRLLWWGLYPETETIYPYPLLESVQYITPYRCLVMFETYVNKGFWGDWYVKIIYVSTFYRKQKWQGWLKFGSVPMKQPL